MSRLRLRLLREVRPRGRQLGVRQHQHHTHIARYFDAYVDHFGFRERITFRTGVEHAAKPDRWEVRLDTGEVREYDALMVANGHPWAARWPEPPFPGAGDFRGVQMHSHDYKGEDPAFFRDKRVVVLGMATRRWTSRSRPRSRRRASSWPRGAARG